MTKARLSSGAKAEDVVECRRLGAADASAMNSLERACFTLPWSLEQCQKAFAQKTFAAFGLWKGERLIAYISFYHAAEEMEILNLAVAPDERRRGHGQRILSLALQIGAKMGMQRALLEVRQSNAAAIALYEKNGFGQCGVRPHYYPDFYEDALIYSRQLRSGGSDRRSRGQAG